MDCNQVNAHERDPYLSFEAESHTYRLGEREMKSDTSARHAVHATSGR